VKDALVIMAKAPARDSVKTRLRGRLTDGDRLRLYTRLLNMTVERLRGIPGVEAFISYWPPSSLGYFAKFGLGCFPQPEGDLGLRMHGALSEVLSRGFRKAAVVGVDIPGLDAQVVLRAFGLLGDSDVVFGPAEDGGYYLVGIKKPAPGLFEGIEWSSEDTLGESLGRASSMGLRVALAESLGDIDTVEDLREYIWLSA
jgi:rSAM/selenodomain-associated transferase 1